MMEMEDAVSDPLDLDPTLDLKTLGTLRELGRRTGKDILGEVVGLYLDRKPTQLELLREALARGDAQTVERTAHSLKGSSANLGALRLARLASDLETLGRQGELGGGQTRLEALETEIDQVEKRLRSILANPEQELSAS